MLSGSIAKITGSMVRGCLCESFCGELTCIVMLSEGLGLMADAARWA